MTSYDPAGGIQACEDEAAIATSGGKDEDGVWEEGEFGGKKLSFSVPVMAGKVGRPYCNYGRLLASVAERPWT